MTNNYNLYCTIIDPHYNSNSCIIGYGPPFPLAIPNQEHKRDISSLEPCALLFKSLIHLHILYNVVE